MFLLKDFRSMKARPFFILSIIIFLVCLLFIFGFGRSFERRAIFDLVEEKPLELPRAAEFFPRSALLSAYCFLDPGDLPDFVEAIADKRSKNESRDVLRNLINGYFALADIDFESEIDESFVDQISFAIMGAEENEDSFDWLLALSGNQEGEGKSFLERFWARRVTEEIGFDLTQYRGIQINTLSKGMSDGFPDSISTALIDENLLLISSTSKVMHSALDIYYSPNKQQFTDLDFRDLIGGFEKGNALLTASPKGLNYFLGFPKEFTEMKDLQGLYADLRIEGKDILLDSILPFDDQEFSYENSYLDIHSIVNMSVDEADAYAEINPTSDLMSNIKEVSILQLAFPFLSAIWGVGNGTSLDHIYFGENGPLVLLRQAKGWVLGIKKPSSLLPIVNNSLTAKGFVESDLEFDPYPLKIWTKFGLQDHDSELSLDTDLAVALDDDLEMQWWGQTISALATRKKFKSFNQRLENIQGMQNSEDNSFIEMIVLGSELSQETLQKWRPWSLMQVLAGSSFNSAVKGLVVVVGPLKNEEVSGLQILTRLSLG